MTLPAIRVVKIKFSQFSYIPYTSSDRETNILKILFCLELQLINNSSKKKNVRGLPACAVDSVLLKNAISYSFLYTFFQFWVHEQNINLGSYKVLCIQYICGTCHFFTCGATAMPSHQVVASSRGRKPQHQAGSSGAAAATMGGGSLDGTHQVMLKMESHSEMSEVSRLTEYDCMSCVC